MTDTCWYQQVLYTAWGTIVCQTTARPAAGMHTMYVNDGSTITPVLNLVYNTQVPQVEIKKNPYEPVGTNLSSQPSDVPPAS